MITQDFKKLKITCLECESEFIINIGINLYQCPICKKNLGIKDYEEPFLKLSEVLENFKNAKRCLVEIICEKKEVQ